MDSSTAKSISTKPSIGTSLMALVRFLEKTEEETDNIKDINDKEEEILICLNQVMDTVRRKGLLQGNSEKANEVINSIATAAKVGNKNSKNNNKRRSHGGSSSNGGTALTSDLMLSALIRITGGNQEKEKSKKYLFNFNIINDVLQIFIVAFQYIHANNNNTVCSDAEYEILIELARPMLNGILRSIERAYDEQKKNSNASMIIIMNGFHAATLIISLFGSKLSRNQKVIPPLTSLAWKTMIVSISDDDYDENEKRMKQSAITFLAAVPLIPKQQTPPATLWADAIIDSIAALYLLLDATVNLNNYNYTKPSVLNTQTAQSFMTNDMKDRLSMWIENMKRTKEEKLSLFISLQSGLSQYLTALLQAEALIGQQKLGNGSVLLTARFPILEMMDILELNIISFPAIIAERLYSKTKKQLRYEIVEGDLFSPFVIRTSLAPKLKSYGLDLFTAMLQALGRSTLLPYANRIMKLTFGSLHTSSSQILRHALDPTEPIRKKKKSSTITNERTKAVELFKTVILLLGSNALVELIADETTTAAELRSKKHTDANKSFMLVIGSLLEILSISANNNNNQEIGDAPASLAALVISTMEAINATLVACEGFLPLRTRMLIDSTIKMCFGIYNTNIRKRSLIFAMSDVKIAFLELLSTCLLTPWNDGAATVLFKDKESRDLIKLFATSDADWNVSTKAKCCLQLFPALDTPRAPPLLHVIRKIKEETTAMDSSSLYPSLANHEEELGEASVIMNQIAMSQEKQLQKEKDYLMQETAPSGSSSNKKRKKTANLAVDDNTQTKEFKMDSNVNKNDNGMQIPSQEEAENFNNLDSMTIDHDIHNSEKQNNVEKNPFAQSTVMEEDTKAVESENTNTTTNSLPQNEETPQKMGKTVLPEGLKQEDNDKDDDENFEIPGIVESVPDCDDSD
mmetsp:Transcript_4542/g.5256  ORF Transcript_4542/g.5256 Transcript_4542/m.5256 type:complete len:917 (+) Transcript_4542:112-2862(+)